MKVTFKAILQAKRQARTVSNGKYHIQEIVVNEPARRDEFGEKLGNDNLFLITAWHQEKIDKLAAFNAGAKVEITAHITGKEMPLDRGDVVYNTSFTLVDIKQI